MQNWRLYLQFLREDFFYTKIPPPPIMGQTLHFRAIVVRWYRLTYAKNVEIIFLISFCSFLRACLFTEMFSCLVCLYEVRYFSDILKSRSSKNSIKKKSKNAKKTPKKQKQKCSIMGANISPKFISAQGCRKTKKKSKKNVKWTTLWEKWQKSPFLIGQTIHFQNFQTIF